MVWVQLSHLFGAGWSAVVLTLVRDLLVGWSIAGGIVMLTAVDLKLRSHDEDIRSIVF